MLKGREKTWPVLLKVFLHQLVLSSDRQMISSQQIDSANGLQKMTYSPQSQHLVLLKLQRQSFIPEREFKLKGLKNLAYSSGMGLCIKCF